MSDMSLRERLAEAVHVGGAASWQRSKGRTIAAGLSLAKADRCIAVFLEHLSANGLAIVPVEATEEMLKAAVTMEIPDEDSEFYWTIRNMWDDTESDYDAMVKATPPTSVLLRVKEESNE